MCGWTDGRMDGWVDGLADGRMDGRMDGWVDGLIDPIFPGFGSSHGSPSVRRPKNQEKLENKEKQYKHMERTKKGREPNEKPIFWRKDQEKSV